MIRFPSISFSPFSFWLGFLTGALFLWLIFTVKKFIPAIKKWIQHQQDLVNRRRSAGLEHEIRSKMLEWAQEQHIAAKLFPLNDIIIEPRLIAPSTEQDSGNGAFFTSLTNQILPRFLDCPELYAQFGIDTISPITAISNHANIVITAQPGMGKTVTLAWLTSQLIQLADDSPEEAIFPLAYHVLDLFPENTSYDNPEDRLTHALSENLPAIKPQKLEKYLSTILKNNQLLIILDGLDEAPPELHLKVTQWIAQLLKIYPQQQFITTGAPTYLGELPSLGFQPLMLTAWSYETRDSFYEKWRTAWMSSITNIHGKDIVDDRLVMGWLINDKRRFTPLEWSLIAWSAFDGLILGESPASYLEGLLDRIVPQSIPVKSLAFFAMELVQTSKIALPYKNTASLLAKYRPNTSQEDIDSKEQAVATLQFSGIQRKKKITSRDKAMSDLLESGLLIEHSGEQIRFINPLITGYLAAYLPEADSLEQIDNSGWPIHDTALRFLAAREAASDWINQSLTKKKDILQTNLHNVSRAIPYSATAANWRSPFLRDLVSRLHDESIPSILRIRLINCLIIANDPSLVLLFKQLYASRSPFIRFSAVLAVGALSLNSLQNETKQLLSDEVKEVQMAACLALGSMNTPQTMHIMETCLSSPQEEVQQIAAEVLAKHPGEGHELLKTAAASDNLLIRRAAIMGLTKVHENWADRILEKLSIEDGQWVVRSVAGHALEYVRHPERQAPKPPSKPENSEWLIQFASRVGLGVPVGQLAIDLMLDVLRQGNSDEKILAMHILTQYPQKKVLDEIAFLFRKEQGPVQEAAYQAILQNYHAYLNN